MAISHYENFPVISLAVPKRLRRDIAIIYWFARTADDLADEGTTPDNERILELKKFRDRFSNIIQGIYNDDMDAALHNTITKHRLNPQYFYDLISAFEQDILKKRYDSLEELFEYCKKSANPVGRLLLQLYGVNSMQAIIASDAVCTGLQLANFWQDVPVDLKKGRIYIPKEFLAKHQVTEEALFNHVPSPNVLACIEELAVYSDNLLTSGFELIPFLPGAFRWQILWTILGGRKILAKIRKNKYNVFRKRVKLSIFNISQILVDSYLYERAICKRNS